MPSSCVSSPTGKYEARVGSVFEIYCEVRGTPHPLISWRANGEVLNGTQLMNERKYLVEVKDRHMAGPIECIANNKVGPPAVCGVMMTVLCE